jgi:hypothetical protein
MSPKSIAIQAAVTLATIYLYNMLRATKAQPSPIAVLGQPDPSSLK